MKILNKLFGIIFSLIIILSQQFLFAAEQSSYPANYYDKVVLFLILVIVIGFVSLVFFESKIKSSKSKQPSGFWAKVKYFLTQSTPIEKEEEFVLKDHNYDGIKELDSKIPPWFNGLFYATIIFSIYYMFHYQFLGTGPTQEEEYAEEIRLAEIQKAELIQKGTLINEETVTLLKDAESLSSGKDIYLKNCAACHANDGGGLVGPNLTDEYWIYGGGIKNLFKIVKYGVPAKGMVSFQNLLTPKQMQDVSSYILTLVGTKPANPKAPEGEIWKEQ